MILFSPTITNLFAFKINEMDHNSATVMGSLAMFDVFNSDKHNTGFGSQYGDANIEQLNTTAIIDTDVADSNAIKESVI